MPELPEVESIKNQLQKYLEGHKIVAVKVNYAKKLEGDINNIIDTKIINIRRFSKALAIDLDNSYSILVHVKMTGQFIYRGPNLKNPPEISKKVVGGVPGKHTHLIFNLDKGGVLYFNDYRKFAWEKVIPTEMVLEEKYVRSLGPEPMGGLTLQTFKGIIAKSKKAIKVLLMDQTKISGVGNIYANDALYLACINPKRSANSLNPNEINKLFKSITDVLKQGVKYGGASELAFVTPDGTDGEYQNHTLVYGREGEPCKKCDSKIEKIKLAGRGTYFCPKCQK